MSVHWTTVTMDLLLTCVLIFLNLVDKSYQNHHHDRWEHISIRYGFWKNLPQFDRVAFDENYTRVNDVCKTEKYHGFLFKKGDDTKSMPIYDLNGYIAGVQTAFPGNMRGYNSLNQTIDLPPLEIMPPVLTGRRDSNGILFYSVTAYFKHPKLICNPRPPKGVTPGKGLYIQMGFDPENNFQHIPLESENLSPMWKRGNCAPMMGTHYFMNLTPSLPCENLYPLFLMYNNAGSLAAFGWVFQGRPHNFYSDDGLRWFQIYPNTYPFLFKQSMLPACMMYSKFQVFGIHIYLQPPKEITCTPLANVKQWRTTVEPMHQTKAPPTETLITVKKNPSKINTPSEEYWIEVMDYRRNSSKSLQTNNHIFNGLYIFTLLFVMLINLVER